MAPLRKMNMHPDMPQPSYSGDSLTNHDMVHGCRFAIHGYKISKERWNEIFGKAPKPRSPKP